jgi:hypothetical protein
MSLSPRSPLADPSLSPHTLIEQEIRALFPSTDQSRPATLGLLGRNDDLVRRDRLDRFVVEMYPLLVVLSGDGDGVVSSAGGGAVVVDDCIISLDPPSEAEA